MANSEIPKRVGRKAIHASPAARAAAYRARRAAKIEAALAQVAAPDTTALETLQSQLVASQEQLRLVQIALDNERRGRESDRFEQARKRATPPRSKASKTSGEARLAVLRKHFIDGLYPRVDEAKRLRVNVKKAVTVATEIRELLNMLDYTARQTMEGDIEALDGTIGLLSSYGSLIEKMQQGAESKAASRIREQNKAHDEKLRETIDELFPNPESKIRDVTKMAEDLIAYEKDGDAWLAEKRGTQRANAHVEKVFELRNAVRANNSTLLARLIAEEKMGMPARGRQFEYHDEICWLGCWADFEEWRKQKTESGSEPK